MKQPNNNFGRISCILFLLKFNYRYYLSMKDKLTDRKNVELLEVILTDTLHQFFNE